MFFSRLEYVLDYDSKKMTKHYEGLLYSFSFLLYFAVLLALQIQSNDLVCLRSGFLRSRFLRSRFLTILKSSAAHI